MTLRHDIKTRVGDSWTSPTWAVILPGGLGVDLTDGWTVTAQVRRNRDDLAALHTYTTSGGGVVLGSAVVQLSTGNEVTTSTVVLHHDDDANFPIFVGPWDCQISKGQDTYTIVAGTFRGFRDVTHG